MRMKYGFLLKVGLIYAYMPTPALMRFRISQKQTLSLYSGRSLSISPSQIQENYSDKYSHRDRMWSSAMHFAIGFFGYPFERQYQQSITIEHEGVSVRSLFVSMLISVIV